MRKKIILLVGIIVFNIAMFIFTGGALYKNVTQEHTIYSKVEEGIGYDELLKFLDDNKIGYTLINNNLKIKKMEFKVLNQEKVEVIESFPLFQEFKGIDERQEDSKVTISYDKDGNKQERVEIGKSFYKNGEYFRFKLVQCFIHFFSLSVIWTILSDILREIRRKKKEKWQKGANKI